MIPHSILLFPTGVSYELRQLHTPHAVYELRQLQQHCNKIMFSTIMHTYGGIISDCTYVQSSHFNTLFTVRW